MRFTAVTSIACIVASATAFQYPDFVPLHRRQEPGTPQYECHANCGGVITASRSEGFCDDSDFVSMLSDCLDCAVEYDIWRYYGSSVSAAAEECGLDGTPIEPSSSSTSTAASETSTSTETITETETETEPEQTSTAVETSTEETISTTEEASSTPTDSPTSVSSTPVIPTVTTTTTPTPPGSSPTSTPSPSEPEYTGAAALNSPAGLFMGGLVGSIMVALM
ncbi:hypothetical protein BDW59DRAFT_37503 [Aspergillus cavernicola]|uniref:Uncharacterized protein n=1 Tax=Aspergillus cavernicola TaxID=176166 RepID=A0ABR4IQT8_9EURO